jgi:hypothetical protein
MQIAESELVKTTPAAPVRPTWSRELLVLCFAFVFVRMPFLFTVPMGEAPDEFAHYWVIRFIKEHLRLPSASEVAAGGPSAVYGSLPQMGYLPHLLMVSFANAANLPFYERFGSLLGGLVLLYAAFHMGRELFAGKRLLRLALPAVLVFHPQLAFLHAYANNDATSSAISAILLLITVRSIKYGVTVQRSLLAGALLGWLALSKYSGLAVVPAVAGGLIAAVFIHRTPVARVVQSVTACIAACAAISGWWFVRNFHEFGGDLLGTQTMYKSWALTFHRDLNYHVPASHIIKELRWWRMMFFSFWGMFGYMNKYLWRPVYITYFGYLIASAIGLILIPVRRLEQRLKSSSPQLVAAGVAKAGLGEAARPSSLARNANIAIWSVLWVAVLTNLAAMIWASTGNLGGPQGRYLFTSELPVISLMLLGLQTLGGRRGNALVLSFLLFNACVCVGSWVYLFWMYGFHPNPL